MKKRVLSIFLIVCLCAALLPSFAAADTPTIQGDGSETNPWILTQASFTNAGKSDSPVKNDSFHPFLLPSGNYKLDGNINLDERIEIQKDAEVTLDLNGHTMQFSDIADSTAFSFAYLSGSYSGTLTLEDTSAAQTGTISGRGIEVQRDCIFNLKGGTISGGEYDVSIDGGTFNMTGGSITSISNRSGTVTLPSGTTLDGKVLTYGNFSFEGNTFKDEVWHGSKTKPIDGGTFLGKVENGFHDYPQRAGLITGGVFRGEVFNCAGERNPSGHVFVPECSIISGGVFYNKVTNQKYTIDNITFKAEITGGVFYGEVENDGVISGGVFLGGITGDREITGTQHKITVDTDNGAAVKNGIVVGDKLYPMEEPTKEGYRFTGWYALGSDKPWDFENDTVTGDIVLTAGWESTQPEEEPDETPDGAAGLVAILDDVPFVDVNFSDYYYDSVKWAYHSGVTGGTDAWHFSPDAGCTRAQAVTFLWRAAGSPSAAYLGNFTDVDADAYYAPAVAWAVANGVTNGTSATTFSPEAACARGDIVTFLYRAFGGVSNGYHPFGDVAANAYYADAVAWAYEHGVTGGTSAEKFSSADACSRAQIVTFLYRVLG